MYAVIDTETTGLSPACHDRVVELAVALVDEGGRVEHEWSTLLNPDRDLGPQHIHGITAAEVINAPRFEDVAGHLVSLLSGRVPVGHNLSFDLMFLDGEFSRMTVPFPLTRSMGVCTMTWAPRFLHGAGRSLRDCCAAAHVDLIGWHCAAADVEATVGLLAHYIQSCDGRAAPWEAKARAAREALWPVLHGLDFTACSRATGGSRAATTGEPSVVARLVDFMPRVDFDELSDPYLAVLDQALADRYVSIDEAGALAALARYLGLQKTDVARLHYDYLNALARLALQDSIVTPDEAADLDRVARTLNLPPGSVPAALERARADTVPLGGDAELPLERGDLIVFTGDMPEGREVWMQRASSHGWVPHPTVTKSVRLVVAADVNSLSGKAKKARGYNIPIMSVDVFRALLGYPEPLRSELSTSTRFNDEAAWAKMLRGDHQ
jgi:DNA polymerase-3 subunit epsilon